MLEELVKLNIFGFLLILSRVGAMMSILPGIAAAYVSMRIRIVLSVLVALVMTPVLTETLPAPPVSPYVLFLLLAGEIIVGVFLGGIAVILISALQTAGTLIALFAAMANALVQDSITEQQSSVIANMLTIGGLLMVFITDSHHVYFTVVADSYSLFVPGEGVATGDMALMLARRVADSFALGFQLSIPFLVIAMVYYIGLGVLGRLMPQLPVFFFGLPVQLTVQLGALMIVFSSIMLVFLNHFQQGYVAFTG
ncbi:MAG: flagellar biosynthetic protein FliR, partial [Rhodospirillales bacterium]|tara:strand:- start:843 stop:1601 length:759 start_codon:yes stop_codon:yes gene_type:complete